MGWDGAGAYVRQHNFSADASAGIKILAQSMDEEFNDFASAMTVALTRNGQNVPTQNLSMGGLRHINVGAPTSVNNYFRVREFIENIPVFMDDTASSADRISCSAQYFTSVSANQAPGDGTRILVRVLSDKSSAVLYLNGHSANVEFQDGNRNEAAMVSGGIYEMLFSSSDVAWKITRPDKSRTAAERTAGVSPVNHQYEPGPHVDCWRFMTAAMIAGSADCGTAIQNALNSLPRGGKAFLKPNDAGYQLGEATITVPYGCQLVGMDETGMVLNRLVESVAINASSLPGGVFFRVTSTSLTPIVLRSNSCVRGLTFWYPDQNWDITSLAESFVTYPTTIQLGDATDAGPCMPIVRNCQFLGATTCIKQYATDGTSLRGATLEYLTGVAIGEVLRVARATDLLHCNFWHFTPAAVTNYVGDSDVGGDADVFRAKCAQAAKLFHLGHVDDVRAVDVLGFGLLHFAHWNNGFYTGDANAGLGGTFIGCAGDSVYQAFNIARSETTIPINIVGGWFAPNFRPNGAAGDSASQAFMSFAAGLSDLRINVVGVVISGGVVNEFPTNYSGERDNDFIAAGVLSTGNNVFVTDFHTRNQNTGIVGAGLTSIVSLGFHTLDDVAQVQVSQAGYDARTGGFYTDGLRLATSDGSRVHLAPDGEDIRWGTALVNLGGGSAPTLGTIGGGGPATAGQNSWMRVVDSTGVAFWVPVWK